MNPLFPQLTPVTVSDSFYQNLASLTEGYHLHLDQFSSIVDFMMAICFREQSIDQLQVRRSTHNSIAELCVFTIKNEALFSEWLYYEGLRTRVIKTHKIEFPPPPPPPKLRNTLKICFRSCSKFKIFGHNYAHYGKHIFYFIFVQFMQFPVVDFGLAHSGSRPFILVS